MLSNIKEYIYVGLIVGLVSLFAYEHFHSEEVQAAKDKAADQRVADAQKLNNQKVKDLVQLRVQQIMSENLPVDITPTTKLVCVAPKTSSSIVPSAGGSTSVPNAGPGPSEQAQEGFDPAPAVIQDGSDTYEQLKKLQKYVEALQEAGVIKKN